jgi:hypothetical protein
MKMNRYQISTGCGCLTEMFLRTACCVISELVVKILIVCIFSYAQADMPTLYRQSSDDREGFGKVVTTVLKRVVCMK